MQYKKNEGFCAWRVLQGMWGRARCAYRGNEDAHGALQKKTKKDARGAVQKYLLRDENTRGM